MLFVSVFLAMVGQPPTGSFFGPGDPNVLPPGLAVSIRAPKTTVAVGQRAVVEVRLANTGSQAIEVSPILEPQAHWISFEISGEHGKTVKFIGPQYKMDRAGRTLVIEPGCFWGRTFDLEKLFDLRWRGRYAIRAMYAPAGPFGSDGFAAIFSDAIELTIKKDVSSRADHPLQSDHSVASSLITSLEKIDGATGSATRVGVRLTNTGDASVDLESRMDGGVTFEVTDAAARRMEPAQPPAKQSLVRGPVRLEPGFFWGRAFDLDKTFNLKAAGRYLVRARYDVPAVAPGSSTATEPVEIEVR